MHIFENIKAKCTWCGKEMKKNIYEEEGIVKVRFSCELDPSCELSQAEIWVED